MGDRRIGVDVGGTFTDVTLALDGTLVTAKVPTTENQSEGVIDGIEKACEAADIDPETVSEFSHAMTVSVNALLEENGAKTALVKGSPACLYWANPQLLHKNTHDSRIPAPSTAVKPRTTTFT